MVKINGKEFSIKMNQSLNDFILNQGYNLSTTVIELNRIIIKKEELKNITLKDGDIIEILNFVGGG